MSQGLALLRRPEAPAAGLCALVVLLVAWFMPLPPIVAGQEAIVSKVIPERRSEVAATGQLFRDEQARYLQYVHTHDLAAVLTLSHEAIAQAQEAPGDLARLTQVRDDMAQVLSYADELHNYAAASDSYFPALQQYDSDLMSWTRSLGAATESMREDTFPFVDHLRLYPLPAGEAADPRWVHAPDVANQIASLRAHLAALSPDPNPHAGDKAGALNGISDDVGHIWESGRSVEYVCALHNTYGTMLQTYDGKVQSKVAEGNADSASISGGKWLVANGLNLALGAVVLAALALLFVPGLKRAI